MIVSTVDRVQRTIMGGLLRGEISPGTWLRQDELAERLDVSKIPVREALQRLAAIGLLRFEPNRGAILPELSAAEAEENYALRRGIEPQLLERALPRLTIVDLAEAEVALGADSLTLAEANWSFHHALYRASGWERGLAIAQILHAAVAPYVVLYTERLHGAADSDAEHEAILDSCRRRDRKAAVAVLRRHLDHASETLVASLRDGERAR
jgi:DNA-binding GntR family transcriptional regulator